MRAEARPAAARPLGARRCAWLPWVPPLRCVPPEAPAAMTKLYEF